jgi:membrane protein YqaA with SNARE-associated domain
MAKNPRVNFMAVAISDAIGFVIGCLTGYGLGQLIGLDVFARGYDNSSMGGIVLVGLGGGLGLQMARRWQQGRDRKDEES